MKKLLRTALVLLMLVALGVVFTACRSEEDAPAGTCCTSSDTRTCCNSRAPAGSR